LPDRLAGGEVLAEESGALGCDRVGLLERNQDLDDLLACFARIADSARVQVQGHTEILREISSLRLLPVKTAASIERDREIPVPLHRRPASGPSSA
jgi:hypothetical protein